MLVCDELGDCFDDGTISPAPTDAPNLGTQPTDSGDPCDPNSVSYDPVACANASGGYGGLGGVATPWTNNDTLLQDEIDYCNNNPGECDQNGVTAAYVNNYCNQFPANCDSMPDGTVGTTTASGSLKPVGGGPTVKVPGVSTAGAGTGGGVLAGINSFLSNLFKTCPAGFVKTANGQCVSASSVGRGGVGLAGVGNGMIGGVSIGTIAIIVIVLILIARKKG